MTDVHFTTNVPEFARSLKRYADAARKSFEDVFKAEAALLGKALIANTPPFTGRLLNKMAASRTDLTPAGRQSIAELEDMSALAIGKRRVEKDIRKVMLGMNNTHDWRVRTVNGKPAMLLYLDPAGTAVAVDEPKAMKNASQSQIKTLHRKFRKTRGRVYTRGSRSEETTDARGRKWRFLSKEGVVDETALKAYIAAQFKHVGQAKGGWASAIKACGGKVSSTGWIGKHADRSGKTEVSGGGDRIHIRIQNTSRWATGGDPDRVIDRSMRGRAEAIEAKIDHLLKKEWEANR